MQLPDRITEKLPGGISFDLILVKGGTFIMGSTEEDKNAFKQEMPAHEVQVSDFYIGEYPVTQAVWQAFTGENPSHFNGDDRPVESVSWQDAREFIQKLNEHIKTGRPGWRYRLPTEAEWEYAARGGGQSEGYLYAGSDKLREVGWYTENSEGETKGVGIKYPNELGLYDMSGNVYEWCADWFEEAYYKKCKDEGLVVNPEGPKQGALRVLRGGGWNSYPQGCRVAYRDTYGPASRYDGVGFRLALQSVG